MKILVALLLLSTVILLLGIRGRTGGKKWRGTDEDKLFPDGMHVCRACPYFQQARTHPKHAQTICPECGLTLLPKEIQDE